MISPLGWGFESHPLHLYKQIIRGQKGDAFCFHAVEFAFSEDFCAFKVGDVLESCFIKMQMSFSVLAT